MDQIERKRTYMRNKPPQLSIPLTQDNEEMIAYAKCQYCLGDLCGFMRTWLPCICCCFVDYPYRQVDQGNEGLFRRFGRHVKVVKPGLHYVNPCTDKLSLVDLRITVLDLNRQSIMTRDNVTISIDACVYYHTTNSRYSTYRVQSIEKAVSQVTYSILKNIVGSFILQELLEKRKEIADQIEEAVEPYVETWQIQFNGFNNIKRGVIIDNIYIKDIQLTRDLQDALSSAATEQRAAKGKLITAKADVEAARLMKEASGFLDSQTAMQVRYLETLGMLGDAQGAKICFVPSEKDKDKLMHNITQGLIA